MMKPASRIVGLAVLLLATSIGYPAPDASGDRPFGAALRCNGRAVTVNVAAGHQPTRGNDVISATRRADVIRAGGGNDIICARGGNDIVLGGRGNDIILGGLGGDRLSGGQGRDTVIGGVGNDLVRGGPGPDRLSGGNGRDRLNGGAGRDSCAGGRHVDRGTLCSTMTGVETRPPSPPRGQIPLDQLPRGFVGSKRILIQSSPQQGYEDGDQGNFRNYCDFSHMNYDDPIVYPGQPGAAHLHSFFGNTGVNARTTTGSLRTSGNGTCSGGIANRSAYWVPSLLDGNGRPVKPTMSLIYYKSGEVPASQTRPMPAGLRMIAGDAKATRGQSDSVLAWMGCGWSPFILECGTGGQMWVIVTFPQCWNGRDLDSPDHKSHMAYVRYGRHSCPASHPVPIPQLAINVFWTQPPGDYRTFRLSSDLAVRGAKGGQTMHADFIEGWEPSVRRTWNRECVIEGRDCTRGLGNATMLVDPPGMTFET